MRFRSLLVAALLGLPVYGSVTTYTDVGAWAVAASEEPNVTLEGATVVGGQLQSTDLTFATKSGMDGVYGPGNGQFIGQLWADCVGKDGCNGLAYDTTTITFDKPVYAFAGNFDLAAGGGLEVYTNGPISVSPNQTVDPHGASGTAYDNFWGFVSSTPFETIEFASSYGNQSFTLADITYAIDPPPSAAPEPSSFALLALAGVAAGLAGKRIRR